jgi:hypothetical protein
MSKISNLLYILGTVVVIAIVLYMIRYYFVGEGFLDLLDYCRTYHKSKAPECMSTTLTCGFDKWKGTDKAQVLLANIPYKTRKIIGMDTITSGTITISALSDLVVKGCIKEYGNDEKLVKECAVESMRPVFTVMSTQYGRSDTATDYLLEPDCKGYAPKDKVHSGSTSAPASTTTSASTSTSTSNTSPAPATSSTTISTSTPSQPQISMADIEKMVQTSITKHITELH